MDNANTSRSVSKTAGIAAVSVAGILIVIKIYGWLTTGSLSLFASLVDSMMDMLVSGLNLAALLYALKPADDDHRFGHTAIEDIVGLLQAAFLAGSGVFIVLEAIERISRPPQIENTEMGIAIMAISMIVTLGLVIYQRYAIKKSGSLIIEADSLHYFSDILTNLAVILSLFLATYLNAGWIDPVIAVILAAILINGAREIGLRAYNNLMDKELPDDKKRIIYDILNDSKEVKGFHDLKTRSSGQKTYIQIHIELDGDQSLTQAHDITEDLEQKLVAQFTPAEIIIHQDPV